MRTKYANPYFKNPQMRSKLVTYLDRSQPKMEGNHNINAYEESQMPVPERAGRTGASWISKKTIFNTTSKSPITRHFYSVERSHDHDSLLDQTLPQFNQTCGGSQFAFQD